MGLKLVVLGLSITSSWGNGHATTYRGLVREMVRRGNEVLFLERDVPWYAQNRDLPNPPYGRTELYRSLTDLRTRFADAVAGADAVVIGSYVPEGVAVGRWALATAGGPVVFYDIDTPITLAKLGRGDYEYLHPELIPRYRLYLSFTGGPLLETLEQTYGSPAARPLYCSVDPELYYPDPAASPAYDLGYMGTYSADRQPAVDRLLTEPARRWAEGRFVVAGPQYPDDLAWPGNVHRIDHLAPAEHRRFYCSQRFTLNVTRADMLQAGWSPSVRLFEAAACGVPVITDEWDGLGFFFRIGAEILVSRSPSETLHYLQDMPEAERREMGRRALQRILSAHTSRQRAATLEGYLLGLGTDPAQAAAVSGSHAHGAAAESGPVRLRPAYTHPPVDR
jgi:spore maturation protein CgeB